MYAANPYEHLQRKSVLVIGAGISGLCAAYWLRKQGWNVSVMERDGEAGGTMKTLHENGWMIETGPNSALETTPLFQELVTDLGILGQRIYADESAKTRYIVKSGQLEPLPIKPGAFLSSRLWTLRGKLRLLKEPFVGRARREESIAEFVRRRLGQEFLDYAVNPFVAGVFAGNPEALSVRSAFPKLYALEKKYGGLVKGMIGSRKERSERKEVAKDRARLFSFTEGMQTLPTSIAATLGNSIKFNCVVERVIPMRQGQFPVYTVHFTHGGIRDSVQVDAVLLAAPAYATADLIRPIDPEMAGRLEGIEYTPVAEVFLGFRKEQIKRNLDGFGFLVPEIEQRKVLGTIWASALFPHRAPEGHAALVSFVGGARQPGLSTLDDDNLVRFVQTDLQELMGVEGHPVYTKIIRWKRAIPQYNLGYEKVVSAMDRFEQNFRGAFVCANYRGGISVGDCVMSAYKAAAAISYYLTSQTPDRHSMKEVPQG